MAPVEAALAASAAVDTPKESGSCLVIGAEADGVAPCVLFTAGDTGRQYLFGASEGFSRLALECGQRPSNKLRCVFLSGFRPSQSGGLGGLLLRLCSDGHESLCVAGPPGVGTFTSGLRDFVRFRHPTVTTLRLVPPNATPHDFCEHDTQTCDAAAESYRDASVMIFPLFAPSDGNTNDLCQVCGAIDEEREEVEEDSEEDDEDSDDVDTPMSSSPPAKRTRSTSKDLDPETLKIESPTNLSRKPRALLGYAVAVRDGDDKKSITSVFLVLDCADDADARALSKHPTLRCCLDRGCSNGLYEDTSIVTPPEHPHASAVFHLTKRDVAARPTYDAVRRRSISEKRISQKDETLHVDCCVSGEVGFRASGRVLARLHCVDNKLFPLSPALRAPYRVVHSHESTQTNCPHNGIHKNKISFADNSVAGSLCATVTLFKASYDAHVPATVDRVVNRQDELDVDQFIDQVSELPSVTRSEADDSNGNRMGETSGKKTSTSHHSTPSILFLGTGSAEPSKYRGSSGILCKLPLGGYGLLDCGEGVSGALTRFTGSTTDATRIIDQLRFIFISHHHADHMAGICGILSQRSQRVTPPLTVIGPSSLLRWLRSSVKVGAFGVKGVTCGWAVGNESENNSDATKQSDFALQKSTRFVLSKELYAPNANNGPFWIPQQQYAPPPPPPAPMGHMPPPPHASYMPPPPHAQYMPMHMPLPPLPHAPPPHAPPPMQHMPPPPPPSRPPASPVFQTLCQQLGLTRMECVPVEHCPEACALILESNGVGMDSMKSDTNRKQCDTNRNFSLCYSGDCRPSKHLSQAAKNVSLFIHEATFGDALESHAVRKRHSTVSEALNVTHKANAYTTILTHFSQRYPKAVMEKKERDDGDVNTDGVNDKTPHPIVAFDGMFVEWDRLHDLAPVAKKIGAMFQAVDEARQFEGEGE